MHTIDTGRKGCKQHTPSVTNVTLTLAAQLGLSHRYPPLTPHQRQYPRDHCAHTPPTPPHPTPSETTRNRAMSGGGARRAGAGLFSKAWQSLKGLISKEVHVGTDPNGNQYFRCVVALLLLLPPRVTLCCHTLMGCVLSVSSVCVCMWQVG
jgi:hypothetical protein